MKNIFTIGDTKGYRKIVGTEDLVIFPGGLLHSVYSTFAMGRDFEWSSRLFFNDLMDLDEEGVGTMLQIDHKGPAFLGEEVVITATIDKLEGMELICSIEARVGDRLIAIGKTGQKMLKKDRLAAIFRKP